MSQTPSIPFGTRRIGPGHPTAIIAEIGINHEGSAEMCARMIEEAARSGADAVKLQTIDPHENYVPGTESHELFKRAWLPHEKTAEMFELARRLGVEPFTTAGDFATLDIVDRMNPSAHKISSGLLTHTPLIRHAAKTGRSLIMSTGMNDLQAIDDAVSTARAAGNNNIGIFQCTSIYPAPPEKLNLGVIRMLEARFDLPCGFSDHSLGDEAAALSVAAGGYMIEKHFSLDPSRDSFDHRLSLDPAGLAELVVRVRRAEAMIGSAEKHLSKAEAESARRFHRCLVARQDIAAGEELTKANLAVMRVQPGEQGLPPAAYDETLGRNTCRALPCFTPIFAKDLKPQRN
jgi:sialic acid synthase SpsE